jgi:hypothetical protein
MTLRLLIDMNLSIKTLNNYGFVVPAKAGTQSIQQAGFPLSRE